MIDIYSFFTFLLYILIAGCVALISKYFQDKEYKKNSIVRFSERFPQDDFSRKAKLHLQTEKETSTDLSETEWYIQGDYIYIGTQRAVLKAQFRLYGIWFQQDEMWHWAWHCKDLPGYIKNAVLPLKEYGIKNDNKLLKNPRVVCNSGHLADQLHAYAVFIQRPEMVYSAQALYDFQHKVQLYFGLTNASYQQRYFSPNLSSVEVLLPWLSSYTRQFSESTIKRLPFIFSRKKGTYNPGQVLKIPEKLSTDLDVEIYVGYVNLSELGHLYANYSHKKALGNVRLEVQKEGVLMKLSGHLRVYDLSSWMLFVYSAFSKLRYISCFCFCTCEEFSFYFTPDISEPYSDYVLGATSKNQNFIYSIKTKRAYIMKDCAFPDMYEIKDSIDPAFLPH